MSSSSLCLPRKLTECIATILGPNVKPRFKAMLKLELKGDKLENRLLVLSQYRLYIFTAKGSPKLDHSFNYVEVVLIASHQPDRITLGFKQSGDRRQYTFKSCDPQYEEINSIIYHIVTSLKTLFPQVPLETFIRKLDLEPRSRLDNMYRCINLIDEKIRFRIIDFPCGGFSNQYICFCDLYGIPYREEVVWDIDTIYAAHNNTELSILDFEHLDLKELLPIISALTFNGYFTKFRVSNVKIVNNSHSGSDQILEQIINLVKKSTTLEEIYFDNTGIRADFVNKLFQAMLSNNQRSIQIIDLSNNQLEDKGLKNMTSFVAKSFQMANDSTEDLTSSLSLNFTTCPSTNETTNSSSNKNSNNQITSSAKLMYKGLVHLNLSHCGITSKGISELAESLYLNKSMFTTLTYLNLSDNYFKDDISKLYNFLAQPNNLAHLDLSGTDCNLETVFGALLHGCTNNLVHLNLSRNQYNTKKASHKELIVPISIKKFFSTAIFLRTLNLSHNKLPNEALKAILLGLACNESAADIRINLSSNDLKSNGAAVLELSLSDIRCVSGLDLSDNGLDMDLINVINAISKNKSIKYLSIGRNFNGIKAKHMPKVLDAFVSMFQDPDCSIESLSLVDSKLRSETSMILNSLGSNQSLINIDISGNQMGLVGAKTLAKALQVNNRLETIYLDRNLIPTTGFFDIAYALERNYTLKYFAIPIQDVQAAMMKIPDRTESAVNKIQEFIRRNNSPQTAAIRNMRLHNLNNSNFSFDNTLFSKIDKTTHQLQKLLREKLSNHHRMSSLDSIEINTNSQDKSINDFGDDLTQIENLLCDVQNMRSLFNKVQEIYIQNQSINGVSSVHENYGIRRSSTNSISRPVEASLIDISRNLKRFFEQQITSVAELIIQCVKEEFPHVFIQNKKLESNLKEVFVQNSMTNNTWSTLIPSQEYFQMCLTESLGSQWSLKLEQILNTVASQICNRFLIEVNGCLINAQQKLLVNNNNLNNNLSCDSSAITNNKSSNGNSNIQHHLHANGNSISRSITPDIILRNQPWIDSFNSSSDSNDILGYKNKQDSSKITDFEENNPLATPKLGSQKRQSVHVRKLRPQSVMDGSINNEELDVSITDQSIIDDRSSPLNISEVTSTKNHVIMTRMRPRNRKTRAPTRVAIVDQSNNKDQQSSKLDEGLDSFFPTVSLLTHNSASATSLESKEQHSESGQQSHSQSLSLSTTSKPQPQPRKILRKLGFKSQQSDQPPELPPKTYSLEKPPKSEEVSRSTSPVIIVPRRGEHVSICSDDRERNVHSPLPVGNEQHNELVAEIKAKQEKRSYNSTPVSNEQLTFASALEKKSSLDNLDQVTDDATSMSVAKRATMFGDLHKSPSKHSINHGLASPTEELDNTNSLSNPVQSKSTTSTPSSGPRQRPKSMVGMLGAKFELSIMNSNSNK